MEWISVEDRLPVDGSTVVACGKNFIGEFYFNNGLFYHPCCEGDSSYDQGIIDSIDSWMPSPEIKRNK